MQFKFLFAFFAVVMMVVLGAHEVDGDCLSGMYRGPCAIWDTETCERLCKEEHRPTGRCTARLQCMCEGC